MTGPVTLTPEQVDDFRDRIGLWELVLIPNYRHLVGDSLITELAKILEGVPHD